MRDSVNALGLVGGDAAVVGLGVKFGFDTWMLMDSIGNVADSRRALELARAILKDNSAPVSVASAKEGYYLSIATAVAVVGLVGGTDCLIMRMARKLNPESYGFSRRVVPKAPEPPSQPVFVRQNRVRTAPEVARRPFGEDLPTRTVEPPRPGPMPTEAGEEALVGFGADTWNAIKVTQQEFDSLAALPGEPAVEAWFEVETPVMTEGSSLYTTTTTKLKKLVSLRQLKLLRGKLVQTRVVAAPVAKAEKAVEQVAQVVQEQVQVVEVPVVAEETAPELAAQTAGKANDVAVGRPWFVAEQSARSLLDPNHYVAGYFPYLLAQMSLTADALSRRHGPISFYASDKLLQERFADEWRMLMATASHSREGGNPLLPLSQASMPWHLLGVQNNDPETPLSTELELPIPTEPVESFTAEEVDAIIGDPVVISSTPPREEGGEPIVMEMQSTVPQSAPVVTSSVASTGGSSGVTGVSGGGGSGGTRAEGMTIGEALVKVRQLFLGHGLSEARVSIRQAKLIRAHIDAFAPTQGIVRATVGGMWQMLAAGLPKTVREGELGQKVKDIIEQVRIQGATRENIHAELEGIIQPKPTTFDPSQDVEEQIWKAAALGDRFFEGMDFGKRVRFLGLQLSGQDVGRFEEVFEYIKGAGVYEEAKVHALGETSRNPNLTPAHLDSLIEYILGASVDDSRKVHALRQIGQNPKITSVQLGSLVKSVLDASVDEDTKVQALGEIGQNSNLTPTQFGSIVEYILGASVDEDTKVQVLGEIGQNSNLTPTQLGSIVEYILDTSVDEDTKVHALGKIGQNPNLTPAHLGSLVGYIFGASVADSTKVQALGQIGQNPKLAPELRARIQNVYDGLMDKLETNKVLEQLAVDTPLNAPIKENLYRRFRAIKARADAMKTTSADTAVRIFSGDLDSNLRVLADVLRRAPGSKIVESLEAIVLPDFNPTLVSAYQLINRLVQALAVGRFALISGPSGSGKSEVGKYLADILGWDVNVVGGHRYTSQEDLMQRIGVISNGGTSFVVTDGALADALINGKLFILDEINLPKPGDLSFLFSILADVNHEFNYYDATQGRVVRMPIHQGFRFIGTQNREGVGRKEINAALANRAIEIDAPAYEHLELVALLQGKYPGLDQKYGQGFSATLVDFYDDIAAKIQSRAMPGGSEGYVWNLRHSMRLAEGFASVPTDDGNITPQAILQTMYDNVGASLRAEDREVFYDAIANYEYGGVKVDREHDVAAFKMRMATLTLAMVYEEFGIDAQNARGIAEELGIKDIPTTARFLRSVLVSLRAGHHPWLKGSAGTGKTLIAGFAARILGANVYNDTLTSQTDDSKLKGDLRPVLFENPDGTRRLGFKHVPSELVRALRDKSARLSVAILDEAAFARPDVLEELNSALDRDGGIWVISEDGKRIEFLKRPENFRLVLASNTYGYGGVQLQSPAFRSRIQELYLDFEYLPEELAEIFRSPEINEEFALSLGKTVSAVRELFIKDGLSEARVSLRQVKQIKEYIRLFSPTQGLQRATLNAMWMVFGAGLQQERRQGLFGAELRQTLLATDITGYEKASSEVVLNLIVQAKQTTFDPKLNIEDQIWKEAAKKDKMFYDLNFWDRVRFEWWRLDQSNLDDFNKLIDYITSAVVDDSDKVGVIEDMASDPRLKPGQLEGFIDIVLSSTCEKYLTSKFDRVEAAVWIACNPNITSTQLKRLMEYILSAELGYSEIYILSNLASNPNMVTSLSQQQEFVDYVLSAQIDDSKKVIAIREIASGTNVKGVSLQRFIDYVVSAKVDRQIKIDAIRKITFKNLNVTRDQRKVLTGMGYVLPAETKDKAMASAQKVSSKQLESLITEVLSKPVDHSVANLAKKIISHPKITFEQRERILNYFLLSPLTKDEVVVKLHFFANCVEIGINLDFIWTRIEAFVDDFLKRPSLRLNNYIIVALYRNARLWRFALERLESRYLAVVSEFNTIKVGKIDVVTSVRESDGSVGRDLPDNLRVLAGILHGANPEINVEPELHSHDDYNYTLVSAYQLANRLAQALAISRFAILSGLPASGKSEVGKFIARLLNWQVRVVGGHRYTSEEDLMQKIGVVPSGEDTFTVVDGPLADALIHGKLLIFDEVNLPKPGSLAFLMSILADVNNTFNYYDATKGRTVQRPIHPAFRMVATQNREGAGRKEMNAALANRAIEIDAPAYGHLELVALLQGKYPELDQRYGQGFSATLVDFYDDVSSKMGSRAMAGGDEGYVWNLRHLMRLTEGFVPSPHPALSMVEGWGEGQPARHASQGEAGGGEGERLTPQVILQSIYDRVGISLRPEDREVFFDAVRNYEYGGVTVLPEDVEAFKGHLETLSFEEVFAEFGIDPISAGEEMSRKGIQDIPTSARFMRAILSTLRAEKAYHPWLKGPAGTGKTELAALAVSLLGGEVFGDTLTPQTDESRLKGEIRPVTLDDGNGGKRLTFKNVPRALVSALRRAKELEPTGKLVTAILDEAAFARPDVLEEFNSLLDRDGGIWVISEDGRSQEFLERPGNFRLILASNTYGYSGINLQSEAFRSRTVEIYMGFEFRPEDLAKIFVSPQINEELAAGLGKLLYDVRATFIKHGKPEATISLRQVKQIERHIEKFSPKYGLANATMMGLWLILGAGIKKEEREGALGNELRELIIGMEIPATTRDERVGMLGRVVQPKPVEYSPNGTVEYETFLQVAREKESKFAEIESSYFERYVEGRLDGRDDRRETVVEKMDFDKLTRRIISDLNDNIAYFSSVHADSTIISEFEGIRIETVSLTIQEIEQLIEIIRSHTTAHNNIKGYILGTLAGNPSVQPDQHKRIIELIRQLSLDPSSLVLSYTLATTNPNLDPNETMRLLELIYPDDFEASRLSTRAQKDNAKILCGLLLSNPNLSTEATDFLWDKHKQLIYEVVDFSLPTDFARHSNLAPSKLSDIVAFASNLVRASFAKGRLFVSIGSNPRLTLEHMRQMFTVTPNDQGDVGQNELMPIIYGMDNVASNPHLTGAHFQYLLKTLTYLTRTYPNVISEEEQSVIFDNLSRNPAVPDRLYRSIMEILYRLHSHNYFDALTSYTPIGQEYRAERLLEFQGLMADAERRLKVSASDAVVFKDGEGSNLQDNLEILAATLHEHNTAINEHPVVTVENDFNPLLVTANQLTGRVAQAIAIGRFVRIPGPSGSGKSEVGRYIASRLGWGVKVINGNRYTSEEDLMQRIGVIANGETSFTITNGVMAEAMLKGELVIFNEINLPKPGNLSFLFSALADGATTFSYYDVNTGRIIENMPIHPNFRVIATENYTGAGRKEVNPALSNRAIIIDAPAYSNLELAALLRQRYPQLDERYGAGSAITLVNFYEDLASKMASRAMGTHGEGYAWNLRHLVRLAEGFKALATRDQALTPEIILQTTYDRVGVSLKPEDRAVFFDAVQNYEYGGIKITPADVEAFAKKQDSLTLADVYNEFGIDEGSAKTEAAKLGIKDIPTTARFLRAIISTIKMGERYHPWLKGPAGTGKTNLVDFAAALLGANLYHDTLTPQTDESQLKGDLRPVLFRLADGTEKLGFTHVPSRLVSALRDRSGKLVIALLDEAAFARPDVIEELNTLLDRDGGIWVVSEDGKTQEFLERPRNFRLVLASNTYGYSGVSLQSDAFRSRLHEIYMDFEFSPREIDIIMGNSEIADPPVGSGWAGGRRVVTTEVLPQAPAQTQAQAQTQAVPQSETTSADELMQLLGEDVIPPAEDLPVQSLKVITGHLSSGSTDIPDGRLQTFDSPVRKKLREAGMTASEETIQRLEERFEGLKKRLLGAAVSAGHDPNMIIEFDPQEVTASIDPLEPRVFRIGPQLLLELSTEDLITVAQHEGEHAEITRVGSGFFFTNNMRNALFGSAEDMRVNARAEDRAPGRRDIIRAFLRHYYHEELAKLGTEQIPQLLPHEAFLEAMMMREYGGTTLWDSDSLVGPALDQAWETIQRAKAERPVAVHPDEMTVTRHFERFEQILREEVYLIYQTLYKESLKQVEEMLRQQRAGEQGTECQQGIACGSPAGRPKMDIEDLSEEARKILEERAKKIADTVAPKGAQGRRHDRARQIHGEGEKGKAQGQQVQGAEGKGKYEQGSLGEALARQRQGHLRRQAELAGKTYSKFVAQLGQLPDRVFQVFDQLLKPNTDFEYEGYFTSGPRIDVRRAILAINGLLANLRVFKRKVEPTGKDYRFSLLVDASGSMADNGVRELGGLGLGAMFVDVFERLGIPYSFDAFHSGYIPLKGFDRSLRTIEERNAFFNDFVLNHWGGPRTDIVAGLKGSLKRILEERKVNPREQEFLFVPTDGEENVGNGAEIRKLCELAARQGIIVVGIGIGAGMSTVRQHFPIYLTEENPENLPNLLAEFIKEYVKSQQEED